MLVVATVAMVPTVGQAFERLIGVWPDVAGDGLGVIEDFKGGLLALALATIAAGLAAFRLVRFPFVFSTVTLAVAFAAQTLVPVLVDQPSLSDRATCFILTGAGLVLVGLVLDSVARRNEAFWWHVVGLLALAVGLTFYAFFRNADWAWVAMLVLGAVLVLASAPFDRATWTTFGVLGVFGAALELRERVARLVEVAGADGRGQPRGAAARDGAVDQCPRVGGAPPAHALRRAARSPPAEQEPPE